MACSLDVIRDLPIDHLWRIEPGTGREDVRLLKREIGDRVTLWGGVETVNAIVQAPGRHDLCRPAHADPQVDGRRQNLGPPAAHQGRRAEHVRESLSGRGRRHRHRVASHDLEPRR